VLLAWVVACKQGYGVSCVRLYGPPKDDHVVTDMRSVIAALSKWLGEVFVAAPASPSRTGVLQFLLSLACTTGEERYVCSC
jgi:hypothetical protein